MKKVKLTYVISNIYPLFSFETLKLRFDTMDTALFINCFQKMNSL